MITYHNYEDLGKDFREEKTESKFPEIVKNIALILRFWGVPPGGAYPGLS